VIIRLRQAGIYARPLGNVIYAMCSPITRPDTCREWLRTIGDAVRDVAANVNAHQEAQAVHMPIV
jgi:adenosylmethionine-8-amino-7-oxononanoate aminotransferase